MPTYQTQHLGPKTLSGYSKSGHNIHYGIRFEGKTLFSSRFGGYQLSNYEFLIILTRARGNQSVFPLSNTLWVNYKELRI